MMYSRCLGVDGSGGGWSPLRPDWGVWRDSCEVAVEGDDDRRGRPVALSSSDELSAEESKGQFV